MQFNSLIGGLIVAASLTACGGGGGSDENKKSLNGTFSDLSGSVLPDPATTAQAITVTVNTSFRGQVEPSASTFDVEYVTRLDGLANTSTGTVRCTLTSGQPGNGVFDCTGTSTLQPLAAGTHSVEIRLNPTANWAVNGTVPPAATASVTVTQPPV